MKTLPEADAIKSARVLRVPASQEKKYAILTCSDAKCGDFVCHHWLESLLSTAGPAFDAVDVVLLDYGLNSKQREALLSRGMVLHCCKKDGHPTNIRYRDMATFLRQGDRQYEQVLSCDGGDIIFQRDISSLFAESRTDYRAAVEPMQRHEFNEAIFEFNRLDPALKPEFLRVTKGQPQINGGFILAPREAFLRLCDEVIALLDGNLSSYASDQVVINYLLRRDGFTALDPTCNYVVLTNHGLSVRDGRFYANGDLISVVHNGGGDLWRSVDDFGIGNARNRLRFLRHHVTRLFLRLRILALWSATLTTLRRLGVR